MFYVFTAYKSIKDKINLNRLYRYFNILKLEDIFELKLAKFMYLYLSQHLPLS